jgi:hypothetical protein
MSKIDITDITAEPNISYASVNLNFYEPTVILVSKQMMKYHK